MTENEMIKKYQYLVPIIAWPYFLAGAENEDLQQEGRIGLLYAVRNYKESEGVKFATYACRCIKNQILKAVERAAADNNSILTKAESLENIDIAGITEDTIVDTAYYKSVLEKVLKNVSSDDRKVIDLYLEGYTYKEISEKLDVAVKSVDNTIQRVRQKNKEGNAEFLGGNDETK